jgi:hypothetical protein
MNDVNLIPDRHIRSAIRIISSTNGALVGFFGIEHGIFETLQGSAAPSGLVIDAIGPEQKLWPGASEPALTIIPSFFVTGICAMIVGFIVMIWACGFIHRKYGARTLMSLCIILFLVGGGSPPLFGGTVASITATRIDQPLMWWRTHLSNNMQNVLVRLWSWSFILFVITSLFAVEIAVLGYPLIWFLSTNIVYIILWIMGPLSDVPLVVSTIAAIAYDIQKRTIIADMQ